MAALQHVAATAAGPVAPTSDNTRWQAGVEREQGSADRRDSAAHAAIVEADKAFAMLRALAVIAAGRSVAEKVGASHG